MASCSTAKWAYPWPKHSPVTRSPVRKRVTPSPTAITSPAISPPSAIGSAASATLRTTGRVTPTASQCTSSSPAPGSGTGASSRNRGPPVDS